MRIRYGSPVDLKPVIDSLREASETEIIEELRASYEMEGEKLSGVAECAEYLLRLKRESVIPNVKELYNKFFSRYGQFPRQHNVTIGDSFYDKDIYTPPDYKSLSIEKIQELVDYVYGEKDPILYYVGYVIYECLHPAKDGNGRLGRMIFLELPFGFRLFPFAKFTSNRKFQLSEINKIFKWGNSLSNYEDVTVDDNIVNMIVKIFKAVAIAKTVSIARPLNWAKIANNIFHNHKDPADYGDDVEDLCEELPHIVFK